MAARPRPADPLAAPAPAAEPQPNPRPAELRQLQRNGMARDTSWRTSAERYLDVYRWAIAARTAAIPA